jgi:ABC-type Mn2+/Zn2+ transport system ATPase subunit
LSDSDEHRHHLTPRWPYSGRGHRDPVPGAAALHIEDLVVRYGPSSPAAVASVSLRVARGERVALVGPNGAGKSTLLKAIAGLLVPESGTIRLFGNRVGDCHHRTAYLPQRADIDWRFPLTVAELVMTGRYVHLGWFRRPGRHDHDHVRAALRRLDIERLHDRPIGEVSGGQQQRALLARALVQEASLFLFDEPLSAVDEGTRDMVDDVLAEHARQGGGVLAATHDLGRLTASFDGVIDLRAGRVQATRDLGLDSPESRIFTSCEHGA